jgi:hypothetical protein
VLLERLSSAGSFLTLQRQRGPADGIEQFNWYPREWNNYNYIPECILPFMDEIKAFCEVSHRPCPLHNNVHSWD